MERRSTGSLICTVKATSATTIDFFFGTVSVCGVCVLIYYYSWMII
jgi:hypothetical protein